MMIIIIFFFKFFFDIRLARDAAGGSASLCKHTQRGREDAKKTSRAKREIERFS